MKHQKTTHANDDPVTANPFQSALGTPMAQAMGRGASVFGRSVSTFQQEGMRFMTRRLEQNVKAVEEFGACKSLPDLLSAQQRWFAEMTRAYSEELAKCGELMTEMLHDGNEETDDGHGSKQHEPPHRADYREH
ncbi:MAG: phasin family protein [Micropepsaceae bacterium]